MDKAPTPRWVLAIGGIGLVIGLATYGYKMIQVRFPSHTYMFLAVMLPCLQLWSSWYKLLQLLQQPLKALQTSVAQLQHRSLLPESQGSPMHPEQFSMKLALVMLCACTGARHRPRAHDPITRLCCWVGRGGHHRTCIHVRYAREHHADHRKCVSSLTYCTYQESCAVSFACLYM